MRAWVFLGGAALSVAGCAVEMPRISALSNKTEVSLPSEQPPTNFTGTRFVDSRGCAYIATGTPQRRVWVPQVDGRRNHVCNAKPTFNAPPPSPLPVAPSQVEREEPRPAPPAIETEFERNEGPRVLARLPAATPAPEPATLGPGDGDLPKRGAQGFVTGRENLIQVGAFKSTAEANAAFNRFRGLGIPVRKEARIVFGAPVTLVILGPFADSGLLGDGWANVRNAGYRDAFVFQR